MNSPIMISRREIIGGGERDRTDDLLLAKQALSQLSYTPAKEVTGSGFRVPGFAFNSKLATLNSKLTSGGSGWI